MFSTILQHMQIEKEDIKVSQRTSLLVATIVKESLEWWMHQRLAFLHKELAIVNTGILFFKTPTFSNSTQIVLHIPIAKFKFF